MQTSARSALEPLTLAAIGVLAAVLANLAHEGLGHGGACLLVGGKAVALSSAWFDCGEDALGPWARRVVSANGTLINLLVGAPRSSASGTGLPSSRAWRRGCPGSWA